MRLVTRAQDALSFSLRKRDKRNVPHKHEPRGENDMGQSISIEAWGPIAGAILARMDQAGRDMVDMADHTKLPYYTVYRALTRLAPVQLPALIAMATAVDLKVCLADKDTGEILASFPPPKVP